MIAIKLFLFFCFYVLVLLDNSLGQQPLVTQGKNKKLFEDAIEFGKKFGGELEELGSQWKKLLIQLVQAKRKLELGKAQFARFNDLATTEEVGLAITDSYADKVAELVAIRVQDIGSTQKYIDDLEILKNEIALTMIVEMDEKKEQFKEKNVRKKVKEAKEKGLTDEDIKELLFAEFIESGGLSLIDAGASALEALLSSFRGGMESILYETYSEKLGILEYGNVLGCLPFKDCVDRGGDNDGDNNGAGGDDFAPDEVGGGPGGDSPTGSSSGSPDGGGDGDDPTEGDQDLDEDNEDNENDEDDEDDEQTIDEEILKEFEGPNDPVEAFESKPIHNRIPLKKYGDDDVGSSTDDNDGSGTDDDDSSSTVDNDGSNTVVDNSSSKLNDDGSSQLDDDGPSKLYNDGLSTLDDDGSSTDSDDSSGTLVDDSSIADSDNSGTLVDDSSSSLDDDISIADDDGGYWADDEDGFGGADDDEADNEPVDTLASRLPDFNSDKNEEISFSVNFNLGDLTINVFSIERILSGLRTRMDAYQRNESFQEPSDRDLNHTARLALSQRRIAYLEPLLQRVNSEFNAVERLHRRAYFQYALARANAIYYSEELTGYRSPHTKTRRTMPRKLPEFFQFDGIKNWYLIARKRWTRLHALGPRIRNVLDGLEKLLMDIKEKLKNEQEALAREEDEVLSKEDKLYQGQSSSEL